MLVGTCGGFIVFKFVISDDVLEFSVIQFPKSLVFYPFNTNTPQHSLNLLELPQKLPNRLFIHAKFTSLNENIFNLNKIKMMKI